MVTYFMQHKYSQYPLHRMNQCFALSVTELHPINHILSCAYAAARVLVT